MRWVVRSNLPNKSWLVDIPGFFGSQSADPGVERPTTPMIVGEFFEELAGQLTSAAIMKFVQNEAKGIRFRLAERKLKATSEAHLASHIAKIVDNTSTGFFRKRPKPVPPASSEDRRIEGTPAR